MPLLPQNDLNDDVYIVSPSTALVGPGRHFPKSLLRSINLPLDVRSLDLACLLGLHEIFSDRIVVLPWPPRIRDVSAKGAGSHREISWLLIQQGRVNVGHCGV